MSSPTVPNRSVPLIASANVLGVSLQVNFPWRGSESNAVCPLNLRAVTWPDGRRIDLRWTNPIGVTRIIIKRTRSYHSAVLTDQAEVIYNGPAVSHFIDGIPVAETVAKTSLIQTPAELDIGVPNSGSELQEDQFYYYTFYMTVAAEPIGLLDFGVEARECGQVTGLSIARYFDQPAGQFSGDWFYRRFSGKTIELDQEDKVAHNRGVGFFEGFSRFVQAGLDLNRGYIKALKKLGNMSEAPAGLIGHAFDQASILKAAARKFGFNPERRLLDVGILRRIAESMIFIYKEKGTCPGLVDFCKLLTLWDSTCAEYDSGAHCDKAFLETWDGQTIRDVFSYQASLMSISAGILVIPGVLLEVDKYVGGLFVGPMGDKFPIASNTETTVTLEDSAAVARTEDLVTITAVTPIAGSLYYIDVTRTAGGPGDLNHNEYANLQLVDSANVLMEIRDVPTWAGGTNTLAVDSPSAPTVGAAAVAPSYLLGAAFANRDPQFVFDLYNGCPTFLWDPLDDLSLSPSPSQIFFTGGALTGVPFYPGDVILTIAEGVADFFGTSTTISGNILTDSTANFGFVDSLVNFNLNPNQNQTGMFRIIANTSTTITVENLTPGGLQLADVAIVGNSYFVLDIPKTRKYEILTRLIQTLSPERVFVFFS